MFEGTGKYFLLILLILFIVYVTKKICLYFLFKRAKTEPYKALIPIYTTWVLVDLLNMKKKIFYLCLIPGINLFYYYQIYRELLSGFGQDKSEAIWFTLIPMYKFPELVFKKPRFILNEYDLTNAFMQSQKALFEKPKEELPDKIEIVNNVATVSDNTNNPTSNVVIEPEKYDQMPNMNNNLNNENIQPSINNTLANEVQKEVGEQSINNSASNVVIEPVKYEQIPNMNNTPSAWDNINNEPPTNNSNSTLQNVISNQINDINSTLNDAQNMGDSVFTNKSLEPDERQEKVFIAKKEEKKEEKPINPYSGGRPQMCPNCGAILSPDATTCFMCGTKLK